MEEGRNRSQGDGASRGTGWTAGVMSQRVLLVVVSLLLLGWGATARQWARRRGAVAAAAAGLGGWTAGLTRLVMAAGC